VAQAREQRADRLARLLARRDRRKLDLRVLRQQAQQLDSRVTGTADNSSLDHLRCLPETKNRPKAAFALSESPPVGPGPESAFRVLLAPPRLVEADLFSLHFPRVAGHEAGRAERRLDGGIELDEGAREAVAHCAGLAVLAAAVHIHLDVERGEVLGQLEGLAHDQPAGLAGEEHVDGLAIYDE